MGKRSKKKAAKKRMESWNVAPILHERKIPRRAPQFRDSYNRLIGANEVIFPIVQGRSAKDYVPVGTGFLIHPLGGFVTARHCLLNKDGSPMQNCLAVQTVNGRQYIRRIIYFQPHETADVGVGMLSGFFKDAVTNNISVTTSFPLSKDPPRIGDQIMTIGYPRMRISRGVYGTFVPDRFNGTIIDERATGSGWLKSQTLFTDMHVPSGASGGPVIRDSKIIGVNSSSFDSSNDEAPLSCITPISAIYELTLRESSGKTTTIQELINNGSIPQPM